MIEDKLWELIKKDISLNDFMNWVYDNPSNENNLGNELYLRLLTSSQIDEVFDIFQDWIYKQYNKKIKLKSYVEVIEVCKHTIKDNNNFIQNINQLVHAAPDEHADWNNDDWGDLLQILDAAEHYPFFVDPSLVSKEFIERMNMFEKEMHSAGIQYCKNILKRYSDPSIIKLANKTQEPI